MSTSSQGCTAWSCQPLLVFHTGVYQHQGFSFAFLHSSPHKGCFFFSIFQSCFHLKDSTASLSLNKDKAWNHYTPKTPYRGVGLVPWVSWIRVIIITWIKKEDGQHGFICWIGFYFNKLLNYISCLIEPSWLLSASRTYMATSTLLRNALTFNTSLPSFEGCNRTLWLLWIQTSWLTLNRLSF